MKLTVLQFLISKLNKIASFSAIKMSPLLELIVLEHSIRVEYKKIEVVGIVYI